MAASGWEVEGWAAEGQGPVAEVGSAGAAVPGWAEAEDSDWGWEAEESAGLGLATAAMDSEAEVGSGWAVVEGEWA